MNTFTNIIKRTDGSYVIDRNGLPYHVPNEGEWADLWAQVNAYALSHPDEVSDEPPPVEPPEPPEPPGPSVMDIINAMLGIEAPEPDANPTEILNAMLGVE